MKNNGCIKIHDIDMSHIELLEDFTAVLHEMGISVSYNYVDDEGNVIDKLDDGLDLHIEIKRNKENARVKRLTNKIK